MNEKNDKNKYKKNNLLEIRTNLKISQKEMARLLGVGERTICNYETEQTELPLIRAITLSKEKNYSLDYIYKSKTVYCKERNDYMVDIRKFINCKDENICFSINIKTWEYINKISGVDKLKETQYTKVNEKLKLGTEYTDANEDDGVYEFQIPNSDFREAIHDNIIDDIDDYNKCKTIHISNEKEKERKSIKIADFFEKYVKAEELSPERKRVLSKISSDILSNEQIKKIDEFIDNITKSK